MVRRVTPRSAAVSLALLTAAPLASATPEEMGPLPVASWDAGSVSLAGAPIHVVVYYPRGASGRPLVGVVHGASRTGAYHRVLAQTLASYGLVAAVPDIPCNVFGCDHDANAAQLVALLDWAASRSLDRASPIAGTIDGTRRGLIGHSWGALASELAAARTGSLASLVLLDPNDDARVGATNAPRVRAPTLQLLAEGRGICNNQWIASAVSPTLGGPWLRVTVPRSGHCDPEEPADALCPVFCGGGTASTTPHFRRYAVAWTLCNLARDPAMATWAGGAGFDADVRAGNLSGAGSSGLDSLACRGVVVVADAGTVDAATVDASTADAAMVDSGTVDVGSMDAGEDVASLDVGAVDANAVDVGQAERPTPDVGAAVDAPIATTRDAASAPPRTTAPAGCTCTVVGGRATRVPGGRWPVTALLIAALALLRRRSAGA